MIEQAINKFIRQIPAIQKDIAGELELLLKSLEIQNGKVLNNINNLRVVGQIEFKINRIVLNDKYLQAVREFTETFNKVSAELNKQFSLLSPKYKPDDVLNEIGEQSIKSVVKALTEDGMRAGITDKLTNLLRQNVTTGISYLEMRNQLKEYIVTNESGIGALQRYVTQITTDALNQFSGQYSASIASQLELSWYQYVGSNIETTREFCELLTDKRYVYQAEIKDILKGKIDGESLPINDKTDLPNGMIPGTNESNFIVYRGGYNCGHQLRPMAESFVPKQVRIDVYTKYGIRYNAQGFKV